MRRERLAPPGRRWEWARRFAIIERVGFPNDSLRPSSIMDRPDPTRFESIAAPGAASRARGLLGASVALVASVVTACAPATPANAPDERPPVHGIQVVNTYPHDPGAFTQGLAFADGFLYEGTGQYGQSSLRKVDLESGKVLQKLPLTPQYFGEGIAVVGDRILQLTWLNQVGFVYDRQTFKTQQTFRYSGEGWGITSDGERLIMSDGSATLRFLDPKTFDVTGRVTVRDRRRPVRHLNELEYVEGEVYANVWGSDFIVRIAPKTGDVLGWIDLTDLLPARQRPNRDAVLNGIAYDTKGKRLFVTGKLWPKLFEIRLVARP